LIESETSVSPKEEQTKSTKEEQTIPACDCEEISLNEAETKYLKDGKLYTGSCQSKNSSNEVVNESKYVNGYLTESIIKVDYNGKLITLSNLKYKDGSKFEGYQLELVIDDHEFDHVDDYYEYKNGEETYSYDFYYDYNYYNGETTCTVFVKNNGKEKSNHHKCRTVKKNDGTFTSNEFIEFFECFIESEKPTHFFYKKH